ncbi:MAG TPA: flagellar assembly protein T N-terminal domain-containing protein [Elusimicrobiales bacterium]|nr:flagellar assembly protein T N-terminal domain-containing protein [Elusimicrobiales bacterium]
MKKLSLFIAACALLAAGCSGTRQSALNPAYETEVVEADGLAPIVDGNLDGAKKTALAEAMKSALGLVVGIYVSQDALVSQSVLIDENITSQSEGYIEKYAVLKEVREGEFYKTRIRAHVRKEDLTAKLRTLETEPRKLGNPVIGFDITEVADSKATGTVYAETELKAAFTEAGFLTGEKDKADIVIKGEATASFNTREGLGGLVSYRAGISLSAVKTGSADSLGAQQDAAGGLDLNDTAAARAALINAAKKAAGPLREKMLKSLREKTVVRLNLANVKSMNDLSAFIKILRNMPAVRDSWVRSYTGGTATLDVGMRKGGAPDLSQLLSKNQKMPVRIGRTSSYDLDAEIQ